MYGGDYINNKLSNDATVTGLVGTSSITTNPAIWNGRMIPDKEEANDTINFYRAEPYDASLEYMSQAWSIDCRSESEGTSTQIAIAVSDVLNRIQASYGGFKYYGTCSILPPIQPADAQDCYNTPVTFRLRRR